MYYNKNKSLVLAQFEYYPYNLTHANRMKYIIYIHGVKVSTIDLVTY